MDPDQARNGLIVGFFGAFSADSEKNESNLFRIGTEGFKFFDFAERNGI